MSEDDAQPLHRGSGGGTHMKGKRTQHGKPQSVVRDDQPDAREGQAGRPWGGGEARSTVEAGQRRGREGASVQDGRKT